MAKLDDLSPEDRGLLIGLPYRAGVWMSHTDDEGGEGDDAREMKALSHIIRSMARAHEGSAFVQAVVQETLKRHEKWPLWAKHSFDILADCQKAATVLKAQAGAADAKAYKALLINVAEAVAAAHGEFGGDTDDEGKLAGFLGGIVERLKGAPAAVNFMNISPAEQDAIDRLRVALNPEN